ncbi:MAG TPA: DoxX family protein [Reyranella sp.]|nr:DoxX family protein [Reyranella sp.]
MDETGDSSVLLVARCLMAGLFLWSAVGQIGGHDETAMFMTRGGFAGELLPAAIAIEMLGAILLVVGYKARWACLALAGFCVVTALLFHANFPDREQMFHFLKNFAIAGGLLGLYVAGPGRLSFDGMNES